MPEEIKQPKTYEEQLNRLTEYHKLKVNDKNYGMKILKTVNYYRLSAYGIGLKDSNGHYLDDITIEQIYNLYLFDSKLRALLFSMCEYIEIELRTKISYCIAMNYGSEGHLDAGNFDNSREQIHTKIMNKLNDQIEKQAYLPYVKHHKDKYCGHFPIWVAIELFTFGNLSSIYSIMKPEDKECVAKDYSTRGHHLKSWILALLEVRNICAHYTRLYNMPLKQDPFLYREHTAHREEIKKLFPVIIVLKYMTKDTAQWNLFLGDLIHLFESYPEARLDFNGFPSNWKEVLKN